MFRKHSLPLAGAAALAAALALPAAAPAAVTVGSGLGKEPYLATTGGQTHVNRFIDGTPHEQVSPVDGVITRWRIRSDEFGGSVRLRVVANTGGPVTGIATGNPQVVSQPISEFTARIPIAKNQGLALDVVQGPVQALAKSPSIGFPYGRVAPAVKDGETRKLEGLSTLEVLINADVEPDADKDGFGDETQDGCPSDASKQGACDAGSGDGGSGGGTGGGGSGGGTAPIADLTPPRVVTKFGRTFRRDAALKAKGKGRLVGTLTSSEGGSAYAQVELAGSLAKRLKLSKTKVSALLATAQGKRATAGDYTLKLQFNKAAQKRLKSVKKLPVTLRITVRDAAGNPTVVTRSVTIKR